MTGGRDESGLVEVSLDDDGGVDVHSGEIPNTDKSVGSASSAAPRRSNSTSTSASSSEDSKKKKDDGVASLKEVFSFAKTRHVRLLIISAFVCALVSGATLPAMAFYFAKAFEDLSRSTNSDQFISAIENVAYSFMILGVIIFVFMTIHITLMETAAGLMTHELKSSWFRALLRQDMAYYDMKDVNGQATLISTNSKRYKKGVGRKISEAAQFTCSFVGSIGYAFWASWQVTLAVLGLAPLLVLSTYFMIKVVSTQTSRTNKTYAKAGSIVSTSVSSIRTILSLNAVPKMIDQYTDATEEACSTAISFTWVTGLASAASVISMLLAYILVDLFGAWLLYSGVRETGCDPSATVPLNEPCDPSGQGVFGALFGVSFAAAVLPQISVALESLAGARAACYPALVAMSRQLEDTVGDEDVEMAESKHNHHVRRELASLPKYEIDVSSDKGLKPEKVTGNIEFKNVMFSFPARKEAEVLKGFSLNVDAGKTVALVGASGSGKSTVVQLLERFYDPLSGSILLDGNDLKSLNVKWLRDQMGLVLQEPKLFGKSIRENISLGAPGVTQERVEEAAKMANAHDFIVSFPEGYDTQVGDLGSQLSGGQKQRIAIARVLLKNPKILLLDEATSALDSESEAAVQQALDGLMKLESATTIVIAHRLSTIKNADMIAVVKDGGIVETGSHEELLSRGGAYHHLVDAQKTKAMGENPVAPAKHLSSYPSDENGGGATDSQPNSEHGSRRVSTIDASVEKENAVGGEVIRFRDVRFRYPSRPDIEVFRGLDLTVRQGETLALVGPSGSGKSTVIALMEAFYRPNEGSVEYHGTDLREINVRWLRSELGLVSQEATLFATTVEENIRYGCPEASMEQVKEAAKKANCHDFITAFPDGYKTQIGGGGGSLVSGGQKQRIAIARAIIKAPKVLLLDEATSALDSESEKVVQAALDKLMADDSQTCIVIAHRLSTIRNADRIAVIDNGKVREIGTHDELMVKEDGRYRRLQDMQNLDLSPNVQTQEKAHHVHKKVIKAVSKAEKEDEAEDEALEISKEEAKSNSRRVWLLGKADWKFLAVGFVGAILAGLFFPAWGVSFAFMTELLFQQVLPCPPGFTDAECQSYRDSVASDMQQLSLNIFYGFLGLCFVALIGNVILFWGFGSASERMNKRVRDSVFTNLLRQEVGWFDVRAPGTITSRLADDAAILHAFAGEPIRTLTLSIASVFVGTVVAFVFMWPFALLTLATLPFLGFGAEMEMRMYMGDDEGDDEATQDEHSSGGIVVETLSNMRTVASLTLENERADEYDHALHNEEKHPLKSNFLKGSMSGLGQFLQMWCFALMFWWGGWLLWKYPDVFSYRSYLISLWGIFFSMYGLTVAFQGSIDREKAKRAAHRIFEITDRESEIDPLSDEGKKNV